MNKLTKFAAMAAFLGLFAACSTDESALNDEQNKVAQEDQTLYVKVVVHGENNNGTRAAADDGEPVETDFKNGEGKESEISTIYFVFYDDEGNIVGNIVNAPLAGGKSGAEGAVEQVYENTVTISLLKGQSKPTKVMCYVNPVSLNDIQKPLSVIQTVTRETVSGADGFPMSNSIYYSGAVDSEPEIAVSVAGKVYESLEEANKATEAVDIYVERRAARLTFKLKDGIYEGSDVKQEYTSAAGTTDSKYPSYDLAFHIDGWDVNAQTKVTYIVKSFRERDVETASILSKNFTYGKANDIINADGGNWAWNSNTYKRSYWAVSPAYFVAAYPEVASDVKEEEELLYIKPEGYAWKTALDGAAPQYYREATVGHDALNSDNPAAAVASVVLKGYYTIGGKAVDFFSFQKSQDGKYFIFPKEATNVAENGGMTMMQRFIELQSVLYKKSGEDNYEQITFADLATYPQITIQHPDKSVLMGNKSVEGTEDLKVASRQQTLQLTGVPTSELYYASGNGYNEITKDNIKDVNLALIHQLGFASFYNKGQAYFNIPIKHLGWYRGANTQKGKANIDWSIVRVGDFGMVRNHTYDIEVESITGLGTGIGTPTDPIIPPAESKDYYVKYKVNVLKWALVPSQKVQL